MQTELLKQYAALETEFRILEEKKAVLRMSILEDLKKNQRDKVESEYGKFTVAHKITWTYTPAVTQLDERLKIARFKEQEKGLAKATQSDYLLFKGIKE